MSAQQTALRGNSKERPKGARDQFARWPGTFDEYYQLTQKLLAVNSIEDALHALVEVIAPTGVNSVTLLLAGGPPDDRRLEVAAAWDQNDEPLLRAGNRFSAEERLLQALSTSRQCIVVDNLITEERISEYFRSLLLDGDAIALVALPLRSEQAFFGAVLIDRSETRAFKSEEIQRYQSSVDLAQGTIERLWLLHESKQAFDDTAALYQISQRLLACHSIDDILHTVLESDLFGAAGGTIALLDPPDPGEGRDPELVFWAAAGASSESILGLRMPLSKGVVGWVVRENQSAIVPDAYSDERFCAQIDQDIAFRTQSILCAPLRVDGQAIGAIELVDVPSEYLREEGVYLLGQVADQAALLIHNQRLLEETQRQARELSLLLDASQEISASTELRQTLDLISSRVLNLVQADGCHVFLIEEDPQEEEILRPVVSNHRDAERILDTALRIGQGISGRVAQSGEGTIVNRVDLDPRGFHVPHTPEEPENLICVPLVSEGCTVGVMTISRLGEEGFKPNDLYLATAVASQAAIILEKTRLLQDAQRQSQELAALNAVVSTASQSLTTDETLTAILDRVIALVPGSGGLVCLVEPPDSSLRLAAHQDLPDQVVTYLQRAGMHDTLCDLSAQKGTTFGIDDLGEWMSMQDGAGDGTGMLVDAGFRSYVGTPLVAQGDTLGTLGLFGREPRAFSPSDVDLLTAIGQQVGVVVHNAQLFEQTQQALRDSTALYRASQAIANTIELEDALHVTLNELARYTGVDRGYVVLFEEGTASGQVAAEYGPGSDPGSTHVPLKGSLWYQTLSDRRQALLIRDLGQDPMATAGLQSLLHESAHSLLLVPLVVQSRLIGMISLVSSVECPLSQAEISFCQTLADRAALAVENRRLFARTFSALQETTLLYQAGRRLTQARDLEGILAAIVDNLPIKQIDQCWIVLTDTADEGQANDGQCLEIKALWDYQADHTLLERRFHAQELPLLFGANTGNTWVANDLDDEMNHTLDRQTAATLRGFGLKSALIVPLKAAEFDLGWLLFLTRQHTHVFDPERIRPYQALADQAAVAIHNQQLLQRVQQSLVEVETVHREYLRTQWAGFLEAHRDRPTAVIFDQGKLVSTENPRSLTSAQSDPNATLFAPLKVRGQVVGTLGLEDPDAHREWTADELQMVQEIADRVAQAVENARLLEETQNSLAETERLYRATGGLSDADTAEKVLAIFTQEVQSALGEEYTGMVLRAGPDPSGQIDWLETCVQWHGAREVPSATKRFPLSQHQALNNLVGQRKPMILRGAKAGPHTPSGSRDGTMFSIPLVAGNSWLGVVNISSRSRPSPEARTLRFLQNLADRCAIALESVRLYEETRRRAVQLEAAAKVSRAATSILDQDKLLSNVVALVRNYFDYHYAQIFLLDPAEKRAELKAASSGAEKQGVQEDYSLDLEGSSLVGRVARTGQPSITAAAQEDPAGSDAPEDHPARAQLAVPIRIGGRVIGVLNVQSSEASTFGTDDVAVLSTLADQLAIAIENARLYQEQLRTAEKLREVDRLKTQFLANMSHELRTPLNSIIGFSRVILKGIDGPVTDLQKQDLTAIYHSGQLLLRLINDVLDISKIAAGKMELSFEETNLKEVIDGVMMTSRALVKDKPDIELRQHVPDDLPDVVADATRLRQVLLNLMSNAVKFTPQGPIQLDADYDDQSVTIRVSDTGIGIPEEKFGLIFQEFEQVDGSTTRAAGGTGLGLPISRHFVEMHGGRMWVESRVGVGSTFFVQIPIRGPQTDQQTAALPDPESTADAGDE
jgi:GAF domain-containing protein